MVDEKKKEIQKHGNASFPVAAYEWHTDMGGGMLELHWHGESELFAVTEGCADMRADAVRHILRPGDVAFIPGGKLHTAEAHECETCRYVAVTFDAKSLCGYGAAVNILGSLTGVGFLSDADAAESLICAARDSIGKPPLYELSVTARILDTLAAFARAGGGIVPARTRTEEAGIMRVLEHIHQNYDKPMTVPQLSAIAYMSGGYFIRCFKNFTGRPPADYIKRVRLSRAAKMLAETDEKIAAVAKLSGFRNLSYFARSFSDYSGKSPTAYRETVLTQI